MPKFTCACTEAGEVPKIILEGKRGAFTTMRCMECGTSAEIEEGGAAKRSPVHFTRLPWLIASSAIWVVILLMMPFIFIAAGCGFLLDKIERKIGED